MTATTEKAWQHYMVLPPLIALIALLLWKNAALVDGVRAGLSLSAHAVIPALFPFSLLSPYLLSAMSPTGNRHLRLPNATVPFLVGLLCGFPLGAKTACDGVKLGLWSRRDAERMLCFCNNTGLAFLVAGVGGAMRGHVCDGVLLFCVQALTALITGTVLSVMHHSEKRHEPVSPPPTPFPRFTEAMHGAVNASLTVTAYIAFFSGLLAVIRTFCPERLFPVISAFFEVGTACHTLAALPGGLPLTAFAVIFSGLSVQLQTASFASEENIRVFPAMICKAVGGVAGTALTALFLYFTT